MQLEELEEVINNIFAAQGKTVPEKIVKVWCKEIASRGFYDQAIHQAEKEMMEEEDEKPTLPKLLATITKYNEQIKSANFKKIDCEWCNGLNYVYTTLFFAKNGKYLSDNYGIKCFHNADDSDCAKMILNPETNNRTETQNGYMLVFKDIVEKESYLEKVKLNGWCDLWVKDDLGNKETEVIEQAEEQVEETEEIIADEDVPDAF